VSDVPSHSPTISPSGIPTDVPSDSPTSAPTSSPSSTPTHVPTSEPTGGPSDSPTDVPTSEPTGGPSDSPTSSPTGLPTSQPTSVPTSLPTVTPSASPTSGPSSLPTTSTHPTGVPTSQPTVTPTSLPTVLPSAHPSNTPTRHPTHTPGTTDPPSVSPTDLPTVSPTVSQAPSVSIAPSSSPTKTDPFAIVFTYMLGFSNSSISASTLDNSDEDIGIMDETRVTLAKVLAFGDVSRRRSLRNLSVVFKSPNGAESIFHRRVIDDECPIDLQPSAEKCVRVVTQVLVFANSDRYDETAVGNIVRDPIKTSMETNLFLDTYGKEEVVAVKYLGDGSVLLGDELDPLVNNEGFLNTNGIAGVAVGSILLVAVVALFAITRSRADDDRDDDIPEVESSDASYNSDLDPEMDMPSDGKRSLPLIDETNSFEATDVARAAQFDPETGGVIPAIGGAPSEGASSSNYSDSSDQEADLLIGRLDAAVSSGDWAAVAAIAGDLSTADEASTMSSVQSSKFSDAASRERDGLSKADAKRAATIDQLINEGDWNAVGATAAAFDSDNSTSSGGSALAANVAPHTSPVQHKKKSILDFIAGPWQSSAASKAIVEDEDEVEIEIGTDAEVEMNAPASEYL